MSSWIEFDITSREYFDIVLEGVNKANTNRRIAVGNQIKISNPVVFDMLR
jgi:hypothetical protein